MRARKKKHIIGDSYLTRNGEKPNGMTHEKKIFFEGALKQVPEEKGVRAKNKTFNCLRRLANAAVNRSRHKNLSIT